MSRHDWYRVWTSLHRDGQSDERIAEMLDISLHFVKELHWADVQTHEVRDQWLSGKYRFLKMPHYVILFVVIEILRWIW